MFSNAAIERNNAIAQNWIDQLFNAGLMAFVGCSMAAVLAVGGPLPDGSAHVTMPVAERLVDQHVFRASSHEPFPQQVFGKTDAPVGQGWG
jgi:hypothetical protein